MHPVVGTRTRKQPPQLLWAQRGEVVAVKTCFVCGKERGFWGLLFGDWTRCQSCGVDYCTECFHELKPSSGSTDEWTEGRDCKKCNTSILIRIPLDYGGWA